MILVLYAKKFRKELLAELYKAQKLAEPYPEITWSIVARLDKETLLVALQIGFAIAKPNKDQVFKDFYRQDLGITLQTTFPNIKILDATGFLPKTEAEAEPKTDGLRKREIVTQENVRARKQTMESSAAIRWFFHRIDLFQSEIALNRIRGRDIIKELADTIRGFKREESMENTVNTNDTSLQEVLQKQTKQLEEIEFKIGLLGLVMDKITNPYLAVSNDSSVQQEAVVDTVVTIPKKKEEVPTLLQQYYTPTIAFTLPPFFRF